MIQKYDGYPLFLMLLGLLILWMVQCSEEEYFDASLYATTIHKNQVYQQIDPRFLSFAVDSSQVFGGYFWSAEGGMEGGKGTEKLDPYDFSRTRLRNLTQELSPAFLRIGGTEADMVYYDLSDNPVDDPPHPYELVMTKEIYHNVADFAEDLNLTVFFTLNAGPGPRNAQMDWQSDQARIAMEYAVSQNFPIEIWELGNEISGYPLAHDGLNISGEQYAADMMELKSLRDEVGPDAWIAGPSSAYWPTAGEMLPNDVCENFLIHGGSTVDLITWHYYPQGSFRCPDFYPRGADHYLLMDAEELSDVEVWAQQVEELASNYAPDAKVALGETGNAQCGGEPGISDVFEAGFWWLDQLGRMAYRGQQLVVRQTLSGSNYEMIDEETLIPHPDYWNSVLWKKMMGARVLQVDEPDNEDLRIYAHCAPEWAPNYQQGAVSVLAINLDRENKYYLRLKGISGEKQLYQVSTDDLLGQNLFINGELMQADNEGKIPTFQPLVLHDDEIELWPASYVFILLPDAQAAACQ